MVAKINRGVSLYGAVIYNQRKVDESTARIITGTCRQQEHGEAGTAYLPEPIGG